MDRWEYMTIRLNIPREKREEGDTTYLTVTRGAEEYVNEKLGLADPEGAYFNPVFLVPELDKYGREGWELVHMQPDPEGGEPYFCAFKRRIP